MSNEQHSYDFSVMEYMRHYLDSRNYNLEYSDDRIELFKNLNNDELIINYINSDYFKNKQIKKKRDALSEHDPFSRVLDSIAYYILKSEYKNEKHKIQFDNDVTGKVLNNVGENNIAYDKNYKIKEDDRQYGYPILSLYAMNRNRSDNFNKGKNKRREYYITDEFYKRIGKKTTTTEEDAIDLLIGETVSNTDNDIYDTLIEALTTPKNVLALFRCEQEFLSEIEGDPASEYYLVLHVIEDVIQDLTLTEKQLYILDRLRDGMTYNDIRTSYMNYFNTTISIRTIKYKVTEIAARIAKNIKSSVTKYKSEINI